MPSGSSRTCLEMIGRITLVFAILLMHVASVIIHYHESVLNDDTIVEYHIRER